MTSEDIACVDCGAVEQFRLEERVIDGLKYGAIVCKVCGKADSGFFIAEFDSRK